MPHILVVDDDPAALQALAGTLTVRFPGVAITTASSAEQALSLISAERFDMVLTDIRMPQEDGIHLLSRIRTILPDIPVLLMSGHYFDEEHYNDILRGNKCSFMAKPVERDELTAWVTAALDRRTAPEALRTPA